MFLCMDWRWGKLPAGSYTYTSHLQYVFQMRGLSLFCTVNTVPHSLRLLTVELICSQVLLTCICSELSVDCLGEETSFIRRLRHCYSITTKDITNTVMQLGRCRMYLQFLPIAWTLLAKLRLIVSKLYTQGLGNKPFTSMSNWNSAIKT